MPTKKELTEQLEELDDDYQSLVRDYNQARLELFEYRNVAVAEPEEKPTYAATISFDLWPLSEWIRLGLSRFHPGRYFQIRVGPIRFDFYEG